MSVLKSDGQAQRAGCGSIAGPGSKEAQAFKLHGQSLSCSAIAELNCHVSAFRTSLFMCLSIFVALWSLDMAVIALHGDLSHTR